MIVKNINGTSYNICACGSWLAHWKNYSGGCLGDYCSEKTCIEKPEVGGHVQKGSHDDNDWYIVPLCKTHNAQRNQSIVLSVGIELAPANISKTCKK